MRPLCLLFFCTLAATLRSEMTEVRTFDGTNNNLANPSWGAVDTPLKRMTAPSYPDLQGEELVDWGNPRDISNAISVHSGPRDSKRLLSSMVWQWGQFLDHDISLTESDASNGMANIMVNDADDPMFPMIHFARSNFAGGTSVDDPRVPINQISTFIDGSNIYGSDVTTVMSLRSMQDGKMAVSDGNLLPTDDTGHFMGGDIRANEQLGLLSMHTLFVREHNRVAELIATNATDLSDDASERDEQIFQRARKVVGAELQAITYNEFLPALLGSHAPSMPEAAYDPTMNPSITNEFSTVLYRFGHSMLNPTLPVVSNDGELIESIELRDAFFRPDIMISDPEKIDGILKGLTVQMAQEVDVEMIDDVRNFLFQEAGFGLDLAALNIQRGRDHGVASYNQVRTAYGLEPAVDFSDVTSDESLQQALRESYVNIEEMDAWIAALGEDHMPGSSVGELLAIALQEQFTRLRDGDRFFYMFDPDIEPLMLEAEIDIDNLTLSQVISNNTSNSQLPSNVFFVPEPHSFASILLSVACLGYLRCRARQGRTTYCSVEWRC